MLSSPDFSFLSFNFPICCFLDWNPCRFENLNSFQYLAMLFFANLLGFAAVRQFWSHSLPRIDRAFPAPNQCFPWPVHSSHQIVDSHVSLSPFSQVFLTSASAPAHVPGIFMYLLPLPHLIHRNLLATAHHSVRCFISSLFLSTKNSLFFWLRFQLFTVCPFFHQTVTGSCKTVFVVSAMNPSNLSKFDISFVLLWCGAP